MKKLLPIISALCMIGVLYRFSPYHQDDSVPVSLVQPQQQDIRDMLLLQGEVVDPAPIYLYPESTSVIEEIYVFAGDRVSAGQPLMKLRRVSDMQSTVDMNILKEVRNSLLEGDTDLLQTVFGQIYGNNNFEGQTESCEVYTLYSTADSVVLRYNVNIGDTVNAFFPCITLCAPTGLVLEATVDEQSISKLEKGLLCEVTIPALSAEKLAGAISSIEPYAKRSLLSLTSGSPKTTIQITVQAPEQLLPGYRAEIRVITAYKANALLVPYTAILQDETGCEYVKLVRNGQIIKQAVTTGSELEYTTEILSGLTVNDLLLSDPRCTEEGTSIYYEVNGVADTGS